MKSKLLLMTFVVLSVLAAFWAMEMTASNPNSLKFYLIYIPLLIFLILEYYFIRKLSTSKKQNKISKISAFFILPLSLLIFLFLSFGENKNKICVSGDCVNGYGEALYIVSERTTKGDGVEFQYYEPEFLGRNWFNNIVWYDGNPINHVYKGEFKNGYFHGVGFEFDFTFEYIDIDKFGDKYKFIEGIYFVEGEWERGWLFWDKESRNSGYIKMNNNEIRKMLKKFNLDKKGYYHGK
jgi:hypothetical protein